MSLVLAFAGKAYAEVQVTSKTIKNEGEFSAVTLQVNGLTDKKIETAINNLLLSPVKTAWYTFSKEIAQNPEARSFGFKAVYDVTFNKGKILSITQEIYQYSGGAHGITVLHSDNVLLTDGSILKLMDLFKPDSNYLAVINNYIKSDIEKRDSKMYTFKAADDNSPFYITQNGLMFYYQQYEIAPYVAGIVKIEIPFSSFKDMLKPGLLGSGENCCCQC